jgi:ABC-type Zn uptake system ZnuABC Zn-binding protein ZnuA
VLRSSLPDALLLMLVALVSVASLTALGALLVAALIVMPAATTRLWTRRLAAWQLATIVLGAVEGAVGLWASTQLNAPPGPAIATLAGAAFAVAALARAAGLRRVAVVGGALAAIALGGAGCGTVGGGGGADVVATTTQIADWARQVAGRDADVHQLLRPNTDPHEYEPRPDDVIAVSRAKLVLANGDGLEPWIDRVVDQSGSHARLVRLSADVPVRLAGEEAGRPDPHWWQDPREAIAAVRAIGAALARADPAHAAAYRANAAAYVARLRRLDATVAGCAGRLAPAQRKLVTDHDAFDYYARRYGFRVVGAVIPAQTTQAEASAGELARLVRQIRRERVLAVFPEESVSPKVAEAVAREAGATARLRLYGDSLGPRDSAGGTYVGMVMANTDRILDGLSGGRLRCPGR